MDSFQSIAVEISAIADNLENWYRNCDQQPNEALKRQTDAELFDADWGLAEIYETFPRLKHQETAKQVAGEATTLFLRAVDIGFGKGDAKLAEIVGRWRDTPHSLFLALCEHWLYADDKQWQWDRMSLGYGYARAIRHLAAKLVDDDDHSQVADTLKAAEAAKCYEKAAQLQKSDSQWTWEQLTDSLNISLKTAKRRIAEHCERTGSPKIGPKPGRR